jgi:hypothetical protein
MSYYGIYDAKLEYMICMICQSESFAWMAEIFACPICGSSDYKSANELCDLEPKSENYSNSVHESKTCKEMNDMIKKRKRSTSDDGRRDQSR